MSISTTACFIGTPNEAEHRFFSPLRQHYRFIHCDTPNGIYHYITLDMPGMVIFTNDQHNTTQSLTVFRELRRIHNLCIIVGQQKEFRAFIEKGYGYQYSVPATHDGIQTLFSWIHRILHINTKYQWHLPSLEETVATQTSPSHLHYHHLVQTTSSLHHSVQHTMLLPQ